MVFFVQLAHGAAHGRHEAFELFAVFVVVFEAALRDVFNEAARGVRVVAKKARVAHGHTQQRGLQRNEGFAHGGQHALVTRDLVDEHAHGTEPQRLAEFLRLGFEAHERLHAHGRQRHFAPQLRRQRH